MSSKLIPTNPADVMVIRDLTPNVVTLSVPFSRGGQIKFGGRATLVRLSSGTLAVFSPVALTPDVRAKVDAMVAAGPAGAGVAPARKVSHIIAPDLEHHIFLSEWKAAYPDAKLIGPNGLPEKRQKQAAAGGDDKIRDDAFAVVFPDGPAKRDVRIDPEFDADFDYEFVDVHANKEIVFLYRPDRILIEADLVFNMPPAEQYQRVSDADKKPGFLDRLFWSANSLEGDLKWARRAQWHLFSRANRPSYNESVARIAAWDFDTLVPCHGDTVVGGAKAKFAALFEWHLKAAAAP